MKKKLKHILVKQWLLFTSIFISLFLITMFFFIFVFEDKFNDKTVLNVANILANQENIAHLPKYFTLHAITEVPPIFTNLVKILPLNDVEELSTYHVTKFIHLRSKSIFLLVYDTRDEVTVWSVFDEIIILISPLIFMFLLISYLLANRFTKNITRNMESLITNVKNAPTPKELLAYSEQQSILEFCEMALEHANVWQQKLALIENEKNALLFLSHEMRTPMQVIQTSAELILEGRNNSAILDRLNRGVKRLSRVSTCVLWLMGDTYKRTGNLVSIKDIFILLLDEYAHPAQLKQQFFELEDEETLTFDIPAEVLETLFSSIILNAIQHGSEGIILIGIKADKIIIENELTQTSQSPGFGIGMQLALKLAEKFSLTLNHKIIESSQCSIIKMRVTIA